jgi:hypothetical protein
VSTKCERGSWSGSLRAAHIPTPVLAHRALGVFNKGLGNVDAEDTDCFFIVPARGTQLADKMRQRDAGTNRGLAI